MTQRVPDTYNLRWQRFGSSSIQQAVELSGGHMVLVAGTQVYVLY